MRYRLTWAAAAALALPAVVTAATWDLDPAHSSVQFSVRHLMVSNVRGEFGKLSGTVQ
ncbi:MAG: protein yceI precursor, partial [Deltaproteobacteria bacterium]